MSQPPTPSQCCDSEPMSQLPTPSQCCSDSEPMSQPPTPSQYCSISEPLFQTSKHKQVQKHKSQSYYYAHHSPCEVNKARCRQLYYQNHKVNKARCRQLYYQNHEVNKPGSVSCIFEIVKQTKLDIVSYTYKKQFINTFVKLRDHVLALLCKMDDLHSCDEMLQLFVGHAYYPH